MDELVVARHGESETAARGVAGGDAGLTEAGRRQAQALGRDLAELPIERCLTSPARRARETAVYALARRPLAHEIVLELADIAFGEFEGRPLRDYRAWVAAHPPDEAPPGGESRVETLRRYAGALRVLARRPESLLVVVGHGLLLRALADERPQPVVAGVPYGSSSRHTRAEVEAAAERLEAWCEAPAW
jgi:broad specificity phosphatase PhoE